jgi:hypothetical protein
MVCLQVHEALEIVKVYPSPLTCAVAYQICMLGGDEASAGITTINSTIEHFAMLVVIH